MPQVVGWLFKFTEGERILRDLGQRQVAPHLDHPVIITKNLPGLGEWLSSYSHLEREIAKWTRGRIGWRAIDAEECRLYQCCVEVRVFLQFLGCSEFVAA